MNDCIHSMDRKQRVELKKRKKKRKGKIRFSRFRVVEAEDVVDEECRHFWT